MALSRVTARGIGTALTAVNAAVPAGKSWTVIGMSLCNTSGAAISIDLLIRETGPLDTYVLKTFAIPAGETLFPWGTLGKAVLLSGDIVYVKSSVAASLDVVMPYYTEAA
jgi:hypothetical protein